MKQDPTIEQEIATKTVAPRVTWDDIESEIVREHYINVGDAVLPTTRPTGSGMHSETIIQPEDLLTICVLVLKNGFTVTGESACVSLENFDEAIGREIARANAIRKMWPLMGYELRSKLASK